MSLLPTDRLAVALCPGRIGIVRRSGWPRAKIVQQESLQHSGDGWREAVDALESWMAAAGTRGLPVDVVLSNRYARFAWLPWAGGLDVPARQALVEARFRERHGDMGGWAMRADDGHYGQPAIACAIEHELIEALRRCFDRRRLACRSLQPHFIAAWNRRHQEIDAGPALFAVVDSGSVVVAAIEGETRRWLGLHTCLTDAGATTLPDLLARHALLMACPESSAAYVVAPELAGRTLPSPFKLVPVERGIAAPVAMAMAGGLR